MHGGYHIASAQDWVIGLYWKGLIAIKTPALPIDKLAEEAKCEGLEKVVIGDDLEKFFQVGAQLPP